MAVSGSSPLAPSPMLQVAISYVQRGWRVLPLHNPTRDGGCSCYQHLACSNIGKHPRLKHGLKEATESEAVCKVWWGQQYRGANIGIATGSRSGFIVLDEDSLHGGSASLEQLQQRYGQLPETLKAATGGGGWHYLFRHPGNDCVIGNRTRLDGLPGLDVRGDGGYIVAAPSLHWSGAHYAWTDESTAIAPCPDWLLEVILQQPQSPAGGSSRPQETANRSSSESAAFWREKALDRAVEGNRNNTGFWLACQLRDDGMREAEAVGVLEDYARDVPGTSYSLHEAMASVKAAYSRPPREAARSQTATPLTAKFPKAAPSHTQNGRGAPPVAEESEPPAPETLKAEHRTDLGNAHRFVHLHGKLVRYVSAWGQWLVWDGTRWLKDDTDHAVRMAKATVANIYAEAGATEDDSERTEIAKWAMRSESDARIKSMLSLAESEPEIALSSNQLDGHPRLLNCENGTLDLQSGELLPHRQTHLLTKRAPVAYDAAAECPTWEKFLADIFAGDEELLAYVQRAVGYSLTSDVTEQCVFIPHGKGANGKSTFLDTLTKILGDYAMTTPTDTLMVKNGQSIPSDVARLMGARFVSASESGDGRRLDEELIKRISGGDRMSARFLHHDWFEFYPVLKLWLAVNHKPTIRGTDHGIWRRIHLIPFNVTFPPSKQDRKLMGKLQSERSGILAWAVRGCLAWQRRGLEPPQVVQDATEEYRTEMDTFGTFLAECCVLQRGAQMTNKALRQAYHEWCDENAEREQPQTRLSQTLQDRGIEKSRGNDGSTVWRGVGLNSEPVQGSF